MLKRHLYLATAGDDGADAGAAGAATGTEDRGDDFTPTDDDAKDAKDALEKAEAEKLAADEKEQKEKEEKDAAAAAALAAGDPEAVAAAAAAAEAAEAEKEKGKNRDTRMPLARHKEILEKERAVSNDLAARLALYEKGQAVAVTNEQIGKDETTLLALESEHAKLVVDGDHVKAAETMRKIRMTERGIIEAKSVMATQAAEARAYERVRYDTTVERLEQAYPVLNPDDTENYDQAVVKEVIELMGAYQQLGHPPAAAIQKAAKVLLKTESTKQEDAVTVKARVDAEEAAKKVAEERKKDQIAKNLAASGKQPPSTKGVGADADRAGGTLRGADAIKLPYQEFIKLDEAQLSKLRGDALV